MNHHRTILRMLLCLLLPVAALAQTAPDSISYRMTETTVIGVPLTTTPLLTLPFSASAVGRDIISQMPRALAIDEPLKLVPGVKVDNQANGSRVHLSIRGQGILTERGIRGIMILLDGIPLNDPTGFAPDFFDVNHPAVERIEVLRGPAAAMYGGGASGGVISITTRQSPVVPLFGEASTIIGSHNFWRGSASVGGQSDGVNYLLSVSRALGDGCRVHTHFSGNTLLAKATITPASTLTITPLVMYSDTYHENPEGINLQQYNEDPLQANPDAVPFNEYLATTRMTGGVTGTLAVTAMQDLRIGAFTRRTVFTEANNHTFNHRLITNPGAMLTWTLRQGAPGAAVRNAVTAGVDAQWQSITERRVDNDHAAEGSIIRSLEDITQSGLGLHVMDRIDIGARLSILASLRYDNITNKLEDRLRQSVDLSGDADFSHVSAHVGAVYLIDPAASVHVGWGQGFLPPATEELAQNPVHYGGFNADLKPATSDNVEAGVRGIVGNSLWYDVTGFFLTTDNDFDRYRITDPLRNQETFYRNAASSRRLGVECALHYSPFTILELKVAYTWSHFAYTNASPIRIMMDDTTIHKFIVDGNTLPNSPEHQLYVDAQLTPLRDLTVGVSLEMVSSSYIDGANVDAEAADGYAMLHARIGHVLRLAGMRCNASLSVRNILDTKTVAFTEPDPGGNAYQPGAGREVFFGLSVGL